MDQVLLHAEFYVSPEETCGRLLKEICYFLIDQSHEITATSVLHDAGLINDLLIR
jgi:hypothetical protein